MSAPFRFRGNNMYRMNLFRVALETPRRTFRAVELALLGDARPTATAAVILLPENV